MITPRSTFFCCASLVEIGPQKTKANPSGILEDCPRETRADPSGILEDGHEPIISFFLLSSLLTSEKASRMFVMRMTEPYEQPVFTKSWPDEVPEKLLDSVTIGVLMFSRASGRIKESILDLPVATSDDDIEEAAILKDESEPEDEHDQNNKEVPSAATREEIDPFGLDALIPSALKKDEKTKGRKDAEAKIRKGEEEETKSFLKSQREALILCLEIAARRYKTPWSDLTLPSSQSQTVIDILVKHAFDNISRFTSQQRDAIGKLWASIREQQTRRKQGKSVSGKLDMNAFESLQAKYANEKISIRRAVGASGGRRTQQWLG
ncbi:hypothetical protein RJ639_010835 [Escallonia herrerae]|uniref:Uncharacterized protein n=1 Tax=Escallonia herrerae TaxID=1293975 RepID=A0AA89AQP9_9ASTE|nr:hypothetical protein RJ639_010835 [Escallonia herrerae]